ncbi:hypothetical protein B0T22DRAFT_233551 [Podospora appendiculata]|uniref:Uncharacterized protein n=1 Tax=Podospora appendiculata TaxID=314037 RepID=A0AAE0X5X3_9PEZI|nr:hypothetical protein B0T22DRAFT_233551 [Podospora appendiculata]
MLLRKPQHNILSLGRRQLRRIRNLRETINSLIADYKLFTHHNSAKLDFAPGERHRLSRPRLSLLEGITQDEGKRLQADFFKYEIFARLYGRPFFCFLLADDNPFLHLWTEEGLWRSLRSPGPQEHEELINIHEYAIARFKMGVVEFRDAFVRMFQRCQLAPTRALSSSRSMTIAKAEVQSADALRFLWADDKTPDGNSHYNGYLQVFSLNAARLGVGFLKQLSPSTSQIDSDSSSDCSTS